MGDEQQCGLRGLARSLKHVKDLCLHCDVECRGGFVGDDQVWIVSNGHRDHRALAHAAGKLVGERADSVFGLGNAYQVKQFNRACVGLILSHVLVNPDSFTNLCTDRVHRRESRQRVLEHHGNRASANFRQCFVVQAEQFIALEVR